MWKPGFSNQDVEILMKETCYEGHHKIVNYHIKHCAFDGTMLGPIERECVERRPAVAVLLFDKVQQSVVLIEQFRPGALQSESGPWLLEVVAGLIDPGETPEVSARREALEEAGCTIQTLMPICAYYPSPGGFNEKTYLYCGLVSASEAPRYCGLPEEHEDIKVHVIDLATALELRDNGSINNGTTLIALYWLERQLMSNKSFD